MAYVGYTGVANQANTSDGFALGVGAINIIGDTPGNDVGDNGVVDRYGMANSIKSYIADETGIATYVLQEDGSKIVLESS